MKFLTIGLLICTLFLISCNSLDLDIGQEEVIEQPKISECENYLDSDRKIRCYAFENKDMSLCADISSSEMRSDCVLVLAEMLSNSGLVDYCSISDVENYKITCKALLLKDINKCYEMQEELAMRSDLMMRDCIELVARKSNDKSLCQHFSTNIDKLINVCGGTDSCKNYWQSSMNENIESCEHVVEIANN